MAVRPLTETVLDRAALEGWSRQPICHPAIVGTAAWKNWHAFEAGEPESENVTEEFHSDRELLGLRGNYGPYRLSPVLRASQSSQAKNVGPALLHDFGIHADLIPQIVVDGDLSPPNSKAYHGGTIGDEIAPLLSLSLGVRLRCAGTSRLSLRHEPGEEQAPLFREVSPLVRPGRPGFEFIPAALSRPAAAAEAIRLESYPSLPGDAQIELARAARSYAEALWWSNEDQNQAWLQLVTAVEIGANFRQSGISVAPTELVETLWPDLWKALDGTNAAVQAAVCEQVAPQMRATRKFIDFLVDLAPAPPEQRPQYGALDWAKMKKHARIIYGHRSDALHGGKPFPRPMLESPRREDDGSYQEVPDGLNTGALDAIWDAKEYPMLLSTFEYIARGSLLNWWDEMSERRG